jgi:hypothetical protein
MRLKQPYAALMCLQHKTMKMSYKLISVCQPANQMLIGSLTCSPNELAADLLPDVITALFFKTNLPSAVCLAASCFLQLLLHHQPCNCLSPFSPIQPPQTRNPKTNNRICTHT